MVQKVSVKKLLVNKIFGGKNYCPKNLGLVKIGSVTPEIFLIYYINVSRTSVTWANVIEPLVIVKNGNNALKYVVQKVCSRLGQ